MRTATLSLPEANPASAPASTTLAPIIGTAAADADSARKADQKSAKAETAAIASLADALASGADAEPHRDTLEIIRSDRDSACASAWATISPVLAFLSEVGAGATVNMGEGIAPLTAPAAAAAIASRMPGGKELNRKAAKTADDAVSVLSARFGG